MVLQLRFDVRIRHSGEFKLQGQMEKGIIALAGSSRLPLCFCPFDPGMIDLAYQSYDWFDMPTYRYDSVVKNPPVDPSAKADGATSGVVMLHAGDTMHFNCHVNFTDQRAAADKHAPMPETLGALHFANEAYNGEMCIQYGNVADGSLGLPAVDSSPVPDFAKLER